MNAVTGDRIGTYTAVAVLTLLMIGRFSVSAAAAAPRAAASDERFDIAEFRVLGNTVLPTRTIETAVYPHLGPGKAFQDVEAAREALENAYHTAGFGTVFVEIPEQKVDDGVVRLHATEGRLHAVRVTGVQLFSGRQLRAAIPAATAGVVPSVPDLQKQLAAFNSESPDRSVVPVLKAGPAPGTVDLDLNVEEHLPLHASIETTNQYSADTKPLRTNVSFDYENLFGRLDAVSGQYQFSPQQSRDVGVLALSYARRLANGGHLSFSYVDSSSDVATVGALDVLGKGRIVGAHYDQALDARPGVLQTLSLGVDYKRFDQTVNAGLGTTIPTPISYALATANYLGTVVGERRAWSWSTSVGAILRGAGSGPTAFDDKCYNCRQDEIVLRADAALTQQLGADFTLMIRAAGQLAADPIVSNEQFLLGGAQSVRGYYEAEELGDLGERVSVELHAPNIIRDKKAHVRPFVFGDGGRIRFQAPLPGQPAFAHLASAGAGIDFDWTRLLTGDLTWARVFDSGTSTPVGASRWLFAVKSSW